MVLVHYLISCSLLDVTVSLDLQTQLGVDFVTINQLTANYSLPNTAYKIITQVWTCTSLIFWFV